MFLVGSDKFLIGDDVFLSCGGPLLFDLASGLSVLRSVSNVFTHSSHKGASAVPSTSEAAVLNLGMAGVAKRLKN